ncbi:MAG TPA: sterol desaturase family protein [Candidatus Binataceae bacterium]|nr:sterol desaturase family protein [Candidatus Binataceae bacterium]
MAALSDLGLMAGGLFAWTLVEYAIHGWMGHRFATFVTPIHAVHHRDPHAVFALGAWLPALAPLLIGVACGARAFSLIYGGLLAGFAGYEALHYRLHFCAPCCRVEARLRTRHLIHHYRAPTRFYGVTSALWDRVFATGATGAVAARLAAEVADIPPLAGRSNLAAPSAMSRRLAAIRRMS